jgi:hypothetical protein
VLFRSKNASKAEGQQDVCHCATERQLILLKLDLTIRYGDLARVACKLNISRARCAYWYRKSFDPDFHPFVRKGSDSECATFKSSESEVIQKAIHSHLQNNQHTNLEGVRLMLERTFQRRVLKSVASRTLQKMGWSWKVPTAFQIAKYSQTNLVHYIDFLEWIQGIDD